MSYLIAKLNQYGGIEISGRDLPSDASMFANQLNQSQAYWQQNGCKVIWLTIFNNDAHLLPEVYKAGFTNHHCANDHITLTKRLEVGALIPNYASHTIGVGGLVINDKNQLLTIRERDHIISHPHNWKFPGGMLDPKEHIAQGAVREVFEETGISTTFESVLGFRHYHKGQFNTSNIYVVCRLTPLSHDIVMQTSEIADARWMDINEYLNDEKIGAYNKAILNSALTEKGFNSVQLATLSGNPDEVEIFIG
ncbi:NUDIX hydrolase [Pseudoalteromonas tunicata]|uniref:MutT domain protein-like n=1 Tax=Pseudoalteromonas tunicata D2 TaxID=87626 RepID=A4C880_9GAMM|nr:NUDIX domain-containing protein [Pseudoalteromonas tunicata]ATC93300.1 hypothetical protein PTUN_a0519 [Pseudoalteromonas tunicata]AXT32353.1 NUDIX domain-containing protein [Pseudoalteromonas tunicata]EAR28795.1 mutT domain protein-like [Pseudoalteromonas tunicata D2]